jgi:hypothetical protein
MTWRAASFDVNISKVAIFSRKTAHGGLTFLNGFVEMLLALLIFYLSAFL